MGSPRHHEDGQTTEQDEHGRLFSPASGLRPGIGECEPQGVQGDQPATDGYAQEHHPLRDSEDGRGKLADRTGSRECSG